MGDPDVHSGQRKAFMGEKMHAFFNTLLLLFL